MLWLTLTGGEIFSRRDFAAIYEHALAKGFLVTLYTNATMVTESIAQLLAERPPFSVEVSIYGADAAHYESTTQVPGSFSRFERGVERLRAAGVPLLMKCPISTLSSDHVDALVEWCTARSLPFKADPVIDARHDGGQQADVIPDRAATRPRASGSPLRAPSRLAAARRPSARVLGSR